ncbi:hypothetical protein SGFS_062420 [Streptomyces graminofaciens]|jgi:magnesium-transporting ATPase (P-type)|uniref:DUF2637 domain-containing protein n=1 Tax=Streptomyces graminofaciens TaxID=68212 RepID=A0ABM7FFI4_9ACTN|nr:DUF2637 domain-containing protein [Streptomyces graminofaciens]BBC34948.1 hypothetical protein SGFS_062420 [Streptomyces graminofaciens]
MRADYDAVGQDPDGTQPLDTQHLCYIPDQRALPEDWDLDEELAQILYTPQGVGLVPPPPDSHRRPRRPASRRRPRSGVHVFAGKSRIVTVAFLIATITMCAVAMLYWSISYSYNQLHTIALIVVSEKMARWWPFTVYGPWLVAGLSIVRASVQNRTARRSWAVMLISSGTAAALCIGQSPSSLLAMVVAGFPPITALVCFRELIGQFSSRYGPRHAADTVNGPKQARP